MLNELALVMGVWGGGIAAFMILYALFLHQPKVRKKNPYPKPSFKQRKRKREQRALALQTRGCTVNE